MSSPLALFTLCTILLQLYMQCSHGYDGKEQAMKVDDGEKHIIRLVTMEKEEEEEGNDSREQKVNASARIIFFKVEELVVGNKIPFYFPRTERAPKFLSRQKADSFTFSSKKFQELARFFSIPPGSPSGNVMKSTLEVCEAPPKKGETKLCPTSKEALLEFVRGVFGINGDAGGFFDVLWTTHLTHGLPSRREGQVQDYNVLSFKEYEVPSPVGCHTMPYPYMVYMCHRFEGGAKVFMTQLEGEEDGERVEAAVLCHMETSNWGADMNPFRVMGTKPGIPVCHIFPEYDLVFIHQTGEIIKDAN